MNAAQTKVKKMLEAMGATDVSFHTMGRCDIIISREAGRWHLSISTPYASPSYAEIKQARYKYLPDDVTMAQLFPPMKDFVNKHPYCHHLWEV